MRSLRPDTKLRFASDAEVIEVARGALLNTTNGHFTVQGAVAYRLLEKLKLLLDTPKPLSQILALADAEAQPALRRILTELLARHVLLKGDAFRKEGKFAEQLNFIEQCGGNAQLKFSHFKRAPIAIIGANPILPFLIQAAADTGVENVVLSNGGDYNCHLSSTELTTKYSIAVNTISDIRKCIAKAAGAILAFDNPQVAVLRRALMVCREVGVPVLPVFTWKSFEIVGTLVVWRRGSLSRVSLTFGTNQ